MTKEFSNTEVMNNGHLTNNVVKKPAYRKSGFRDAGKFDGEPVAFTVALERFYSRLMEKAARDSEAQKERKHQTGSEISAREKEISAIDGKISNIKTERLAAVADDIAAVNREIRDIKENPEKYSDRARDNFMYYTYLVLLAGLTLFLVVFYSSVIYSAFFRQITNSRETIYNSVFYTNVFSEASRSIEMLLMVSVGPLIFVALGAILHNLFKKWREPGIRHKTGLVGVLLLTFAFDSLLAFHIAKKLHDAAALNSFERVPVFTVGDAAVDPNFWLVIFFGFAVYLILGSVLFLFDKERNTKLALDRLMKSKEDKLAELHAKESKTKEEIRALEDEIHRLKMEIAGLNASADKVYFSPNELRRIIAEYTFGWLQYIHQGKQRSDEPEKIQSALERFYGEKGILPAGAQHNSII